VLRPRVDAVYESGIGRGLRMCEKPGVVDRARIVSAARFGKHIGRLTIATKPTIDRRSADAEHLGRRFVRLGEPFAIGANHATPHIHGEGCHLKVGSRLADRVNVNSV
jgi:hypothetical protein